MTKVRLEDLPPKLRAQALEKAGDSAPGPTRKGRPAPLRGSGGAGPAYRCHTCGETFARWGAAAERHSDENHHHRLDAILV